MSVRKQVSRGTETYKQFIGNKAEGQGFADKRKRKIKHEYTKTLSKQRKEEAYQSRQHSQTSHFKHLPGQNASKIKRPQNNSKDSSSSDQSRKLYKNTARQEASKKFSKFTKSQRQFSERDIKRRRKKEIALKKKEERKVALENYVNNKQERHKKLCKRTYKGQPVMKNQMELLLQKIEKDVKT